MTPRALPPWAPPLAYLLAGGVGACALLVSGFELYSLARNAGFSEPVSVALPVGLDLGAAAAAVLWVAGPEESAVARTGRSTAWALVLASAVLNGLSVLAEPSRQWDGRTGLIPWQVLAGIAFLVAVSFPMVAAGMAHMVLLTRTVPVAAPRATRAARGERPAPAPRPDPAPTVAAPAVPTAPQPVPLPAPVEGNEEEPTKGGTKQEQAREYWRAAVLAGEPEPSPADCNRHVGGSNLIRNRHLDQWREQLATERRPHLVENG